jgi:hypothetical protein
VLYVVCDTRSLVYLHKQMTQPVAGQQNMEHSSLNRFVGSGVGRQGIHIRNPIISGQELATSERGSGQNQDRASHRHGHNGRRPNALTALRVHNATAVVATATTPTRIAIIPGTATTSTRSAAPAATTSISTSTSTSVVRLNGVDRGC